MERRAEVEPCRDYRRSDREQVVAQDVAQSTGRLSKAASLLVLDFRGPKVERSPDRPVVCRSAGHSPGFAAGSAPKRSA